MALVLARLMGLKTESQLIEFTQLADDTLCKEYGITTDELINMPLNDFETWLLNSGHSADKLDALAKILYLRTEPLTTGDETLLTLQKVLHIFDVLEQKHHRQSFENISKRKYINSFINSNVKSIG